MRGRRGEVVGWAVVIAYAALMAVVAAKELADDRPPIERPAGYGAAAESLLAAVWQSRTGTFVATGVFERRSELTGARIASEAVIAQRPPKRLQRELGGVRGRVDDRLLLCPAHPDGQRAPCQLGAPSGTSYRESVERELATLRSLLTGPARVYDVKRLGDGCFGLERRRPDPRTPYGERARLCFDPVTGAPTLREIHHRGGIVEIASYTSVRAAVTDADLAP